MSEVPAGWLVAKLAEMADRIVDGSHNPPKAVADGYPMLSARNISNHEIVFDDFRFISTEDFAAENARTNVSPNDVLLTIVGTIGRTAVVPENAKKFALQRSVAVIKPRGLLPKYLAYAFETPKQQQWLAENAKGTAQKGVYLKVLGQAEIPIAPWAEQHRIVEKLEELLSDLDVGVAELKAAQAKLTQYRQSLLKAAVEGALTADWRAGRAKRGEATETGAQLLERILAERRKRWEAKQLARFKEQRKAPPKGWQDKYPEPVKPDATDLPELPEGWVWATLDQLVAESSYGTSVKCGYESKGIPVLRIPNIVARKLDLRDLKFANEDVGLGTDDYLAQGDVLVVRTNGSIGLVGRAAEVAEPSRQPLYFASYLLRLRCVDISVSHKWVSAFLASSVGRHWIERRAASSAGQHNISLSTLLTMTVPLPSLAEQNQSLQSLDAALHLIVEQERALEVGLMQAAAQRKNILKSAFSGQLVPQDPNDEPASVLLERIRAEREAAAQPKAVRKPRTSKVSHA